MALEIERKFLVRGESWRRGAAAETSRSLRQGYLMLEPDRVLRVRLDPARALLALKVRVSDTTRSEFEYEIPRADAEELLTLCVATLEKTRHLVPHGAHTWEVDEFHGRNAGLVVAEIELAAEDEAFERPDWLGDEVTSDPRYVNARLALCPHSNW